MISVQEEQDLIKGGSFDFGRVINLRMVILGIALLVVSPTMAQSTDGNRTASAVPISASTISGQISKISDTTHLEFKGLPTWTYELKRLGPKSVSVAVPAFDSLTETQLRTWKDSYVDRIEINKGGPDGKYEVVFHFTRDDIESFDYLTDDPSRLIIDFYQRAPLEEAEKVAAANVPSQKPANKSIKKIKKEKSVVTEDGYVKHDAGRSPAGSELLQVGQQGDPVVVDDKDKPQRGIFDGGDPDYIRFRIRDYEIKEDAVIASKQNIYIRFPMLKLESSEIKTFLANPPEYSIKPRDGRENKEARLLLHLYQKGRYAVFLKTYQYFQEKYKDSIYDELVKNLAAEVHYKVWQRDGKLEDYIQAKNIYLNLVDKYPDSVLSERNQLLVAYSELGRGNGLEIIQRFQDFIKKFPKSNHIDWARKALAEGYLQLGKFDDALAVYQELEKNFIDKTAGAEATYRFGDVHFARKDYKSAVEAYQKAISGRPEYQNDFPNAWYNMAESKFWLGQHKESLNNYLEYIKRFPSHPHGGYALTRVGELLEILGADRSRVMGAFLESYFRFRSSEGANIARIRMLSQRMQVMKDKELRKAMQEMEDIVTHSTLPKIREFITLMITDGFHRRGEYGEALNSLVSYYQNNPNSTNLEFFRSRILKNITDSIRDEVVKNNYLKALDIYSRYAGTWLRRADRMDVPYLVANAYEQAGVVDEAESIYGQTLRNLTRIKGTREEKERRVSEHLPTIEAVNLRLASVATKKRKFQDAFKYLQQIKNDKNLSPQDKVERVELAANLAEERGQLNDAKAHLKSLIQSWSDKSDLLASTHLRLAGLQHKTKENDSALDSLKFLENLRQQNKNSLSDDLWARTLQLKGEVQMDQGKTASAVETYTHLLEEFEQKRPMHFVRYRVGNILFEKGDLKGAEKIWSALDDTDGSMYKKLAMEKLENARWQDEYKRYINRIPAAVKMKQE